MEIIGVIVGLVLVLSTAPFFLIGPQGTSSEAYFTKEKRVQKIFLAPSILRPAETYSTLLCQQAGWFKQCLKIKKADMPNPIEENNNFFTCAQ